MLLWIVQERMWVKTEIEIADEQAGFRQENWCTRHVSTSNHSIMCFVNFKKAFDLISHDKLWVTMMDIRYPLHLIDFRAKLYTRQLAKVKVAGTIRMVSCWERSPTRLYPYSILVQRHNGNGDEGDPRWISRWTANWRANSHEPLLCW